MSGRFELKCTYPSNEGRDWGKCALPDDYGEMSERERRRALLLAMRELTAYLRNLGLPCRRFYGKPKYEVLKKVLDTQPHQ